MIHVLVELLDRPSRMVIRYQFFYRPVINTPSKSSSSAHSPEKEVSVFMEVIEITSR